MDSPARHLPPQLLDGLPPLSEAQQAHLLAQIDQLVESRRAAERKAGERVFSALWKQVAQANFEYRFMDLMDAAVLRIAVVLLACVAAYLLVMGALLSALEPPWMRAAFRALAWLGLFIGAPWVVFVQVARLYRQAGEVRRA